MRKATLSLVMVLGLLPATQALADAGRVDGYVPRECNAAPRGCYKTSHADRTTKWLYFFSDRRQGCYVRMKNCGAKGCGFMNVKLDLPVRNERRVTATAHLRGNKRQDYVFNFDGAERLTLDGHWSELRWDIKNYTVDPYQPGNKVTSYFVYAGGDDYCR